MLLCSSSIVNIKLGKLRNLYQGTWLDSQEICYSDVSDASQRALVIGYLLLT